jgi:hypothetical protein
LLEAFSLYSKKRQETIIEELDLEPTVRRKIDWLGVIKDWN